MDESIRTIEVELLRSGPPHNQLLSPLTQYLAVCGDAGAGTVTIPFEQAAFNRRLGNLRYRYDDEQDDTPRLETLRLTGGELGTVLDSVPGLVGSLAERSSGETLLNLRVITSASELALLPYELAKVPSGAGRPSEEWLALRPGTPLCISRRVRSVAPSRHPWPRRRPRVLLIVGLDIDDDLRDRHCAALAEALGPWRRTSTVNASGRQRNKGYEPLDIREGAEATMPAIRRRLESGYTAVHILAHGAESDAVEGERYGLLLQGTGDSEGDVVTGERFASAFRSLPSDTPLPSAIVAASCDSAYQADVLVPGGSFAQALHLIGIPLVVASQFPLTYDGSVLLTEMLYKQMLWGDNPLPAIASIRAALHAEFAYTHDWASLVVYDALPTDLDDQLEEVRFNRARDAINAALHELDEERRRTRNISQIEEAEARAEPALGRLPTSGLYAMEVGGLKGSFEKRMAGYLFETERYSESRQRLEMAQRRYREATHLFYSTGGAQRKASLNWLETQAISLDRILGTEPEPGSWEIAMRSCERDLADGDFETRAWAHGSIAELFLLRMFEPNLADRDRGRTSERAREHTLKLLDYYPRASDFPIFSTKRQFERYVDWWGSDDFVGTMGHGSDKRSPLWPEVINLAAELVAILDTAIQDDDGAGNP